VVAPSALIAIAVGLILLAQPIAGVLSLTLLLIAILFSKAPPALCTLSNTDGS
jgi:hypothetical protein